MAKSTCNGAALVPPSNWSLKAGDGVWTVSITYRAPPAPAQQSSSVFSAAAADDAMTQAVEWYLQTRIDFAKAAKELAVSALEEAKAVFTAFRQGTL